MKNYQKDLLAVGSRIIDEYFVLVFIVLRTAFPGAVYAREVCFFFPTHISS